MEHQPGSNSGRGAYLRVPQVCPENGIALEGTTGDSEDVFDDDDLFDSPRLFTEMATLTEEDESKIFWKETARWVRFEEDVEVGGQRWSKPRVSTLSLKSLFELRKFLINGTVSLDVEGHSIEEIFNTAVKGALDLGKLTPDEANKIGKTLNRKCVHLFEILTHKVYLENGEYKRRGNKGEKVPNEDPKIIITDIEEEKGSFKGNKPFMKKLHENSEAANVLVGEVRYLKKPICVLIRLKNKVHLGNLTEVSLESRFIFLILGPMGELESLSEVGRSVATLLSDEVFREVAYKGRTKAHILAGIDEFLNSSTLLPPGEWDPDIRIEPPQSAPTAEMRKKKIVVSEEEEEEEENRYREKMGLTRTGRLFGGLINDIKRKAPHYVSDFTDAFAIQTVATFSFLYFACLAPIVTFGGLLGKATGNNISVMESLVSGLICGVTYGIFGGQPLTILGSTGPVLVFETILYEFCQNQAWHYLSFRFWIGMWAAVYLFIMVALDASSLVCYITRFTEENFACLIALIFIVKAGENVYDIGKKFPMHTGVIREPPNCQCSLPVFNEATTSIFNETFSSNITYEECDSMNGTMIGQECENDKYTPDVFVLCVLLCVGTLFLSSTLKEFRTSKFFPYRVRVLVSDFAVITAIIIMASVDYLIGIATPKLEVPLDFVPTIHDRGWVTYPFNGNPWWSSLLASIPALLACILIFMDQQITAVIMNRKELKLKKGGGYHLDLLVLSFLIAINSLLGLPWFVAATVLSINHVNSLKLESAAAAPGEKPQFFGVRENRVTNIVIFLFIGLSVKMTALLQKIPMAVLYGVFLYMGTSALKGVQFYDRILLMFMPVKHQPDHPYLRKVPLKRVHIFTAVQLFCFGMLWLIKSFNRISIMFPLMLVVIVFIRKALDFFFTKRELKILDDVLPEFDRKEKLDREEKIEAESDIMEGRKKRILSISLTENNFVLTPASAKIVSENADDIEDISDEYSRMKHLRRASRRGSEVLKQIRRDSVFDTSFVQQPSLEEEPYGEAETSCYQRKKATPGDALNEEETQKINIPESTSK